MSGDGRYRVVVNDEEQFSIWPEGTSVPAGWRAVTEPASQQESLDRVAELWTDIRPLSVRRRLA
ncbi:MAG TPA: MbtH family NRPS accessory protein [Pseudonocardiaceae bacterium]|jgi:MbtH protein|nr:MbtH family NRPS accessory protein [Pseudonocardiaceae bacterium]